MGCSFAASALYHQQGRTKLDVQKDSQVLEFGLLFTRMAVPAHVGQFAETPVSEDRDCVEHAKGSKHVCC